MAIDDNCCGCWQLETGGYIIGWLSIVGCVLGILGSAGELINLITNNCAGDNCNVQLAGVIIAIILFIIILIIAIYLISGMKTRNAKKVFPFYVVLAIEVGFIALATIIAFVGGIHWVALVPQLIYLLLAIYFFIIIRAIYHKFQNESQPAGIGA